MENTAIMFLVNRTEKYTPSLPLVLSRLTIVFAVLRSLFFFPAAAQCTVAPTAILVQPTCLLNTGTITVTSPAPGTGITYTVSGASYNNTNATGIFLSVPPGTYSVTAKLLAGCTTPALPVTLNAPSFPGTVSPATATICSTGSQVLTATAGGTSYQWYRVGTVIPVATTTVNTFTVTQAGTYYAIIVNGLCSTQTSNNSVINVVSPPNGSISPAAATVCAGGSIILTANGGGTYQWSLNNNPIQNATAATYQASQAGTYSVVISNGVCSAPASNTAAVTIEAAPTGTIAPSNTSTICSGSSQLLTVSGGPAGASYQWFMGNLGISGATAATYSATQAGVYSVDIISPTGCKARSSNSATVAVLPLPGGSISPATVNICSGSTVTLTATGGISYQWYLNGTQTSVTSATFSASAAGNYAVEIFDANSCKGKSSNESIVTVTPTPTGTITPATATVCPGDSIKLTASGGTSYQWYRNGLLLTNETAATYNAKQAGNYTVDIFSGICKGGATNPGVVTLGTIPTGSISPATGSICSGNSITLTATGGTSYQWALNGSPIAGATSAAYIATQTGTYTVTISNGTCKGPASNNAVISPSTAIGFTTTVIDLSCTAATGTITVSNPTGGTGTGYTYSKDNGTTFQTANVFSGLLPGTYEIVVKDAAGCKSASKTVVINAFTSTLAGTSTSTNITCTQPAGTVTVTASGGTSPYQYSLDGGAYQTSNAFANLPVGAHKVTVKDAAGCLKDVTFTITQIQSTLAAVAATVTNASCGQANGAVSIQATGGTGNYTFSLDNGAFGGAGAFSGLAVGVHKVTVKDGAGCTYDVNFEVKQLFGIPNLVVNNPAKICPGTTANLQASAVTAGSDAGLTFSYWKDANAAASLPTPGAVAEGTYYIRAVNGGGCVSSVKPVVVTAQTVFPGSITFTRTTACFTDSLPLMASGGVSYQWFRDDLPVPGATRVIYNAKQSGVYSVLIGDGTCAVKASNTVRLEFTACTPIFDPQVFVPTAFTPNRNGLNDVLRPIFYNITTLTYFKVYNRWGQQVFQTATPGKGWDGTKDGIPQPPETYSWILECVGKNGEIVKQSGRSLLIR